MLSVLTISILHLMLFWTHSSLLSTTASVKFVIRGPLLWPRTSPNPWFAWYTGNIWQTCSFLTFLPQWHLSPTLHLSALCPSLLTPTCHPDFPHWSVLRLHFKTLPYFPPLYDLTLLTLNSNCVAIAKFLSPALVLSPEILIYMPNCHSVYTWAANTHPKLNFARMQSFLPQSSSP